MVVLHLPESGGCAEDIVCLPLLGTMEIRSTHEWCFVVNHDDFMSRYLLLKNGRNEVLSRI